MRRNVHAAGCIVTPAVALTRLDALGTLLVPIGLAFALATGHPLTIIGPLAMTYLLTRLSDGPLLEKKLARTRPGYAQYVARTSSFVPWLPKA